MSPAQVVAIVLAVIATVILVAPSVRRRPWGAGDLGLPAILYVIALGLWVLNPGA